MDAFLARHRPVCEERAVWGKGRIRLRVMAYLTTDLPPLEYVTSVRAIVLRGDSVLVVRDSEHTWHILPGGRREPGEDLQATLGREVLEETGWTIRAPAFLGVMVFHHLTARPAHYAYPYPEFVQLVYVASGDEFRPLEMKHIEYETEAEFRPIDQVRQLGLPTSQQVFLNEALRDR